METVSPDKINDLMSEAQVGWLHLKIPHHFNSLTHLIFHYSDALSCHWNVMNRRHVAV